MTPAIPRSSAAVFAIIKEITTLGWVEIPPQFQGTGAPGNTLEYLANVVENNKDSPDLEDWELKFHGGKASLVTLFHYDPEPRGILKSMVDRFGWDDGQGRISFRHTIRGSSPRGFQIINENDRIIVRNINDLSFEPFWQHNTLLGQMGAKLRRLIVVHGNYDTAKRLVRYNSAVGYWDVNLTGFCAAIENGIVCVDFDCRTSQGRGTTLRNHGTKFRISINDIGLLYSNSQCII